MTWTLPEPMLTSPTPEPTLKPGWAAEPKWDGYRALLRIDAGRVMLRSRCGTEMTPAFPEIVAGAAQLPDKSALDGELVVWEHGRLAFEQLQGRLQHRKAGAVPTVGEGPAHFVAFDLLRMSGTDTTSWPYRRRRAALESLFTARKLTAPWALCPSTTDQGLVGEWLTWTTVGMEGIVFKQLDGIYQPSRRGWLKYKVRETTEAIVGAITGTLAEPRTLLLGRYDTDGQLHYSGRTTTLPQATARTIAGLLAPARHAHPWTGWTFSAGWGPDSLDASLVQPELVVEIEVDTARDAIGRWRHPVRLHRPRADLQPADIPTGPAPAFGQD